MKKQKMTMAKWLGMGCLIASTMMTITGCSSDDEPSSNNNGGGEGGATITNPKVTTGDDDTNYASLSHCSAILFNDSDRSQSDSTGTQIGNGDDEFCFTGKQTLKAGKKYILKGWVYCRPGSELTIPAGTIIVGDKETKAALIIEPGAKIHATGTEKNPIVFTSEQAKGSRKPGDWGGVIICGKAPNNNGNMAQQIEGGPKTKHGGTDKDDNSGEFQYVRIEYAGFPFEKDKEINGLTLGSVGAGTKLDHVQVSYSNDDSFEWFGGTVNAKYLIAYKGWDDDFDTDNGYSGSVQFGLAYRDSKIADTSYSNTFESDNNKSGTTAAPITSANFANITTIGPKANDEKFDNTATYIDGNGENPNNGASLGQFQSAAQIRRGSHINIYNSVFVGWPVGLMIDGQDGNTLADAKDGKGPKLQNVFMANMTAEGSDKNSYLKDVLIDWSKKGEDGKAGVPVDDQLSFSHGYFESQKGCKYFANQADLQLKGIGALLNVVPTAAGVVADWSGVNDSWFDTTVNYAGAFSGEGDTWATGWTNFDPQNTDY